MTASVDTGFTANRAWPLATAATVCGILILLGAFWETAWTAVRTWEGAHYGHGYLIIPIALFMIWHRRANLAELQPRVTAWGILPLAGAAALWLIGDAGGVQLVKQAALIAMIQGLVFTLLGPRVTRVIIYPLLFLFFCVPFGEFMIAPLQEVTADFVVRFLQLTGIPVFLDGWMIDIPTGRFHVAEACSGARYMVASIALGFLVSYLFYTQIWRRVVFVGISILVPIIANGLRAYGIVMLAHMSDMEIAVGADHIIYGLVFLSVVIFLVIALGVAFRERTRSDLLTPPLTLRAGREPKGYSAAALGTIGLAALALAIGARAYASTIHPEPHADVRGTLSVSLAAPWRAVAVDDTDWSPRFPTADLESSVTFDDGDARVRLVVAFVAAQRQDSEIVSEVNQLTDFDNWSGIGRGEHATSLGDAPLAVRTVRMKRGETGRLVWYWYWVDGSHTGSQIDAKLRQIRTKILGGERAAAVIAVTTTYSDQPADAVADLDRFMTALGGLDDALARLARPDAAATQ